LGVICLTKASTPGGVDVQEIEVLAPHEQTRFVDEPTLLNLRE
jgi:hypothetical protein